MRVLAAMAVESTGWSSVKTKELGSERRPAQIETAGKRFVAY
jgi:hypothetical protein